MELYQGLMSNLDQSYTNYLRMIHKTNLWPLYSSKFIFINFCRRAVFFRMPIVDYNATHFPLLSSTGGSFFKGEDKIPAEEGSPFEVPYDTFFISQPLEKGGPPQAISHFGALCAKLEGVLCIQPMVRARKAFTAGFLPFILPHGFNVDLITQELFVTQTNDETPTTAEQEAYLSELVDSHEIDRYNSWCLAAVNSFIKLFNCKNIEVQDVVPSKSQQKRRKQVKPLISYKTLVISPGSKSKKNANRPHQGGENRVHLCRGHFKTYTEDAPLLGHGIGTYWWAPMARGSRKKGVVHKDYKIKGDS